MTELKEIARITCKRLRKETKNAKIVFYQSNGRWSGYYFWIKANSVLELADRNFLELIQQDDPKAVVVNSGDFIEANGDGSILVDDMVSGVLYLYSRGQANISDFLDYYTHKEEEEQTKSQKVNQKILEEVVNHCWNRLWKERYSHTVFWKKDEHWDYHMFYLAKGNIIPREYEVILRGIQEKDNNAIVINGYVFRYLEGDGAAEYIASEIEKYRQNKDDVHNISVFLAKYGEKVEKQDVMTIKEIVEIMEKRLKQLANYERFELSNGNSTSTEMLEIAKFLIGAKTQGLGWEE